MGLEATTPEVSMTDTITARVLYVGGSADFLGGSSNSESSNESDLREH